MKVYVITSGDYSDYHICAVTLDKEKAEKYAEHIDTGYQDVNVEEYDTDHIDTYMKYGKSFHVEIYMPGFRIDYVYGNEHERAERIFPHNYTMYGVDVNAKDKDHAVKVATDRLAKYLAEEEGIA